jgi:uncharacterized membrane protein YgcG
MLISKTLLLMASSLALATPTLAQELATARNEVHDPDGLSRHGPQKVPQRILDVQRRWIELEAVPRHHGVHGREAPARATPQRFAPPATSKAAASRAATQGASRDRAAPNSSDTAVAKKSAVPAVEPKVTPVKKPKPVGPERVTSDGSGAWLKDFWKNQERQSGGGSGGGSEGGGSGGGGGGGSGGGSGGGND